MVHAIFTDSFSNSNKNVYGVSSLIIFLFEFCGEIWLTMFLHMYMYISIIIHNVFGCIWAKIHLTKILTEILYWIPTTKYTKTFHLIVLHIIFVFVFFYVDMNIRCYCWTITERISIHLYGIFECSHA